MKDNAVYLSIFNIKGIKSEGRSESLCSTKYSTIT